MTYYNCAFEYEVTPKGDPRVNMRKGLYPYRETSCIDLKSIIEPTKEEISKAINTEWRRKGISNYAIIEIYSPEKLY